MGNHPKISKQGTKHHEFSPLIYSDGLPPVVKLNCTTVDWLGVGVGCWRNTS